MAELTVEELARCVEILESIVADRTRIASAPEELRVALMIAAGRVSRPSRLELTKKAKAIRKIKREQARALDRAVRAAAGIRVARRDAVYSAPDRREGVCVGSLKKPRCCYVC